MKCVKSTTISVLVNGSRTDEFKMDRGLHQGDPHSPFFSSYCSRMFECDVKCLCEWGIFTCYVVGEDSNFRIIHQFPNDMLLLGEKIWEIFEL